MIKPIIVPACLKHFRLGLIGVFVLFLAVSGCGKKKSEAETNKPFTLPGAAKVIEALEKKDYETTVSGLAEIKASVEEKDLPEYRRLRDRVVTKLDVDRETSPPAQEAYRAIGMMEAGR